MTDFFARCTRSKSCGKGKSKGFSYDSSDAIPMDAPAVPGAPMAPMPGEELPAVPAIEASI